MRYNLNPVPQSNDDFVNEVSAELYAELMELIADGRITVSRREDGELIYKALHVEDEADPQEESEGGYFFNN
jgi:hypothetical protein